MEKNICESCKKNKGILYIWEKESHSILYFRGKIILCEDCLSKHNSVYNIYTPFKSK